MTKKGGKNTQNFSHFNRRRGNTVSQSIRFVKHPHNQFFDNSEHERQEILHDHNGIFHYKQHLGDRKLEMAGHRKNDLTERILEKIKNHK